MLLISSSIIIKLARQMEKQICPKLIKTSSFINFQQTNQCCHLPIRSLSSKPVWFRLLMTNPDNYDLSKEYGVIDPGQQIKVHIRIKLFESISPFNYIKNKLQIISLQSKQKSQTPLAFIGHTMENAHVADVPIIVECIGFKKMNDITYHLLTRHIKITPFAKGDLHKSEYEFVKSFCERLGPVDDIIMLTGYIHVKFTNSVEDIEPRIMVLRGQAGQIMALFSLSYFSTFTGKQRLNDKTAIKPSLKMLFDLQVAQNIVDFHTFEETLICKTNQKLLIYNTRTHQSLGFPHTDFKIALFSPYLCVVMEKKYMIFYDGFEQTKVIKCKMKKLFVKSFCKYNNHLYVGGRNCSKVPLIKSTTARREIYIIHNFDTSKAYNIPDETISLPDSQNDVEVIIGQNPYLFVYCKPSIYLISLKTNHVVITLNRPLSLIQLLEGRYANSLVSAIGITDTGSVFRVSFERFANVHGVEVNESHQKASSLCQAKDGRVFLSSQEQICEFHAKRLKVISEQKIVKEGEKVKMIRTNTKGDIVVLKESEMEWVVEFYKQV